MAIEFAMEQLRSMLAARHHLDPFDSASSIPSDSDFMEQALASVGAYLGISPTDGSRSARSRST
jgi:hypothetical protein